MCLSYRWKSLCKHTAMFKCVGWLQYDSSHHLDKCSAYGYVYSFHCTNGTNVSDSITIKYGSSSYCVAFASSTQGPSSPLSPETWVQVKFKSSCDQSVGVGRLVFRPHRTSPLPLQKMQRPRYLKRLRHAERVPHVRWQEFWRVGLLNSLDVCWEVKCEKGTKITTVASGATLPASGGYK